MSKLPLVSLFGIIIEKRSSIRFLIGTIGGLSFSLAVILSTLGLMDGFEVTLKKALAHSSGDIKFMSMDGFYIDDGEFRRKLDSAFVDKASSVLQVESFALVKGESKGILLRGINKESFSHVTSLDVTALKDGLLIGSEFKKKYNLEVGDFISLAFASGKLKHQGSAKIEEFRIDGVVKHGVFEKDLRFVYLKKRKLEYLLSYKEGTANLGLIKIKDFQNLEQSIESLDESLEGEFRFEPYWSEFEVLLDAVKIEKISISLVLQLIVIVSILNIVGFIIFLMETKSQDFFMLRALGLSLKSFQRFWLLLLIFIWVVSCFLSKILVLIFSLVILKLPFLKIPGDIYVLSELELILDVVDYVYVFGISFAWILLIGFLTMRRMKKKSLIANLRQEFS